MAHFAEIDDNNIVVRILVIDDSQEHRGEEFLSKDLGLGGRWIQTSYNNKIRGKFAGIGDFYDSKKDLFIGKEPTKEEIEAYEESLRVTNGETL